MKATGGPLSGRVAIVTGGGRGLGRAMALGLAGVGCRVVITGAREQHEVAAVAREGGPHLHALVADVTREEDCARVVDGALSHFGRLDILVNNAGRGMKYVSERFLKSPRAFGRGCDVLWRRLAGVRSPIGKDRHVVVSEEDIMADGILCAVGVPHRGHARSHLLGQVIVRHCPSRPTFISARRGRGRLRPLSRNRVSVDQPRRWFPSRPAPWRRATGRTDPPTPRARSFRRQPRRRRKLGEPDGRRIERRAHP